MAAIYMCDICKQELNSLDGIRFWGSKILGDTLFCQACFQEIENYIVTKYFKNKTKNEQSRP